MLATPVALFIFNRPDTTREVFVEIARSRPRKLLLIADGPRSEAEEERCLAARAIVEQIDWDCEVLTNYSDVNLGCKRRVSSGLNWVFEQCSEAIVLEDDCLPHPTFFRFCTEMLDRYKDDERVVMVSGNNFQFGRKRATDSYYYSCYVHIWGWASWRRAWRYYDVDMRYWPELKDTPWLVDILGNDAAVRHWRETFDKAYAGQIDTWDIQFLFACWAQHGLNIVPNINLVTNIGFGAEATHTKNDIYGVANLPAQEIIFPLQHPALMVRDKDADQYTFDNLFAKEVDRPSFFRRLGRRVLGALPSPMRKAVSFIRETSAL